MIRNEFFERRSPDGDTRHWANSDVLTTPAAQATHNRYSPRCVIWGANKIMVRMKMGGLVSKSKLIVYISTN